jgi:rare lipoprotein A
VNARIVAAVVALASVLASGCAHQGPRVTTSPTAPPERAAPAPEPTPAARPGEKPEDEPGKGRTEKGLASWYGEPYHGRRTASGEIYDMHELTAAHRTLAFGTVVEVTRRDTGAEVRVRVNDRGPFVRGRIIDLSYAAARKIDLDRDGVAPVKVRVVGFDDTPRTSPAGPERSAGHPGDGGCLWVQVGAFADLSNARRAERRLEAAGEPAVIVEGPGGLHRVRLGPFDVEQAAARALERIRPDWPEAKAVPCG